MIENALVHIYTGEGKGKTTAAFGLAFRAAGDNNKVLIYQFLKPKSLDLSERKAAEKSGLDIDVKALDFEWNMKASQQDALAKEKARALISEAIEELTRLAEKKTYNMIVLDEIVFCVKEGLAEITQIKELIERRHKDVEIVLTGRGANWELIDLADIVSKIEPIKHPFEKGIYARKGIEY